MANVIEGKRWSGFDWADQQQTIMMIGVGGIGSWTALSLSRIMHKLYLVDDDMVDETNVQGGQMYRQSDIGHYKVQAVQQICRDFGCVNSISCLATKWDEGLGMTDICITGLDNMAARKQIYEAWKQRVNSSNAASKCLFIDGRMAGELYEIFTLQGDKPEQFEEYEKWLFEDSEVEDLDCTMKQTTFVAMGIASAITSTLCNFLANKKSEMEYKEVPFHQRFYVPALQYDTRNVEPIKTEAYETNIA